MHKFREEFISNIPDYVKGIQIPPSRLYEGGYDRVTVCEHCKSTAYYYDRSQFRICQQCGAKVILMSSGYRWVTPVYEKVNIKIWFWEYIKETDTVLQPGYWEIADKLAITKPYN